MFDLNKKDGEADQAASSARSSTAAASSTPAMPINPAGAGQFVGIGRSIQIQGDVRGEEDLVIEGKVNGTIELKKNHLTIGADGTVKANVYARSITVDGTTEGDLFATEKISIRSTAKVRGNLLAPIIALEDGAQFKGSVEMDQQAVDKAMGGASQSVQSSRQDAQAAKPEVKPASQASAVTSDS
jgi:cytoskeletal protein CcmA (bactofilin family)